MTFLSGFPTILLAALIGSGCAATGPASGDVVLTGEVTYRQRIALPPEATVTVKLEDVSLADASAIVLATQTIETGGRQVPIPFSLSYDASSIDARHTYAVRAEIRDARGRLMWTTDTHHAVLTGGAPTDDVEIVLAQVSEPVSPDTGGGMMPGPEAPTVLYTCEDASGGSFSFMARYRGGALEVDLPERFGSRKLVVSRVASASGSKYESDGVMVWKRGATDALLGVGDETFECSTGV